jgi:hypothetical protein
VRAVSVSRRFRRKFRIDRGESHSFIARKQKGGAREKKKKQCRLSSVDREIDYARIRREDSFMRIRYVKRSFTALDATKRDIPF